MPSEIIHIKLKDCSPIQDAAFEYALVQPIEAAFQQGNSLFQLQEKARARDPILEYRDGKWWTGRYVGEALFQHKEQWYKLSIAPRFGDSFLFLLLEEIFNLQFAQSSHQIRDAQQQQHFIKRIIAQIWVHKLATANRYGLPRQQVKQRQQSPSIRGKLDVRSSILPLYTRKEVVSTYHEKQLDGTIASILLQAYQILQREYGLPAHLPSNAENAVQQLLSYQQQLPSVQTSPWKRLRLKSIYRSYRSILELSLDIIRKQQKENQADSQTKDGYAFFLDMAEVWELYLKSLLQKYFGVEGWEVSSPTLTTYEGHFFQRKLIPDLVLQRAGQSLVFDAKYKRMKFHPLDVDRSDFFQIHTYLAYYEQQSELLGGGLLYPFSSSSNPEGLSASSLLSSARQDIRFCVDGVDLSGVQNEIDIEVQRQFLRESETFFVKRVNKHFALLD